jgi:hypothetical protein
MRTPLMRVDTAAAKDITATPARSNRMTRATPSVA